MTDPMLFALAVLALLGTPGPTNTLLATSGALVGAMRSLPLIGAEIAGYLLAILTIHVVLAPTIAAYPAFGQVLRLVAGLYLVLVAIALWRRPVLADAEAQGIGPARVFVTTLLNPKAAIFALVVLPLSEADALAYLLAFSGLVVVVATAWILVGAGIGRLAAGRAQHGISRVAAVVLACFAGLIVAG
ncbi:MAG: lysine transporter LysE [Phreatobacter sp.]|uniref:LysE family translocator n=1 Tax=Phreatobacter sp. TaxID=1966341 RepID=UPI001A4AEACF|nr:lysine transporter LysE [Phreatobacter sp.]MBL8570675.1 lysine transporter LysE [Phreatobacter sp.]